MYTLRIKNPEIIESIKTYLTTPATAGSAVALTVENNDGWAANDYVKIGKGEKAELQKLSSITAKTTITVGTLNFPRGEHTLLSKMLYNQIEIQYRSSSGGTFATIATVTMQIDQDHTEYVHTTGVAAGQYKWRFKNETTSNTTAWSDTLNATGFTKYQAQKIIDTALSLVQERGQVDDALANRATLYHLLDTFNDYFILEDSGGDGWWFLEGEDSSLSTINNTQAYTVPSTVEIPLLIFIPDDSDIKIPIPYIKPLDFREKTARSDLTDYPAKCWTHFNGQILLDPTPDVAGKTIYIWGYLYPTTLNSPGDTTEFPAPYLLSLWLAMRLLEMRKAKGDVDLAVKYRDEIKVAIKRLIEKKSKIKQVGYPNRVRHVVDGIDR